MSPRNYYSKNRIDRYNMSPSFVSTASGMAEKKVERFVTRVLRSIFKSRRRNKS
jgi:hypothetical protein